MISKATNRIITQIVAPDGKVVSKKTYPFRSFLRNYEKLLFNCFSGGNVTIIYRNGSTQSFSTANTHHLQGNAGNDGKGILVGASAQAVDFDDINLAEMIPHGDLHYSLTTKYLALPADGGGTNSTSRSFWNVTESPITVRECALAGNPVTGLSDSRMGPIFCRDIIDETIPPDYKLYIRYELSYQVDPCTRNHAWWMAMFIDTTSNYNFINISGSSRSKSGHNNWFKTYNNTLQGVFAGASTEPFSNTHNALQGPISTSDLVRVGANIPNYYEVGNMGGAKISRIFENVTEEPITVNEIALYVGDRFSTVADVGMVMRHVFSEGVTIAPGAFHEFGFNVTVEKP